MSTAFHEVVYACKRGPSSSLSGMRTTDVVKMTKSSGDESEHETIF